MRRKLNCPDRCEDDAITLPDAVIFFFRSTETRKDIQMIHN